MKTESESVTEISRISSVLPAVCFNQNEDVCHLRCDALNYRRPRLLLICLNYPSVLRIKEDISSENWVILPADYKVLYFKKKYLPVTVCEKTVSHNVRDNGLMLRVPSNNV
jgi:hypothetical protein